MQIIKADQDCYIEATANVVSKDDILLGLYDNVEERYFALISVKLQVDGKKKSYISIDGLYLDSNSPALLKVFETETIKYLKLKGIKYLKTTINSDVDIKTCGLKYSDVDKKEVTFYASNISKIFS